MKNILSKANFDVIKYNTVDSATFTVYVTV